MGARGGISSARWGRGYVGGRSRMRRKSASSSGWGAPALVSPKDDPRRASALTAFKPLGPSAGEDEFAGLMDASSNEARIVVRCTSFAEFAAFADDGADLAHRAIRVSTHLVHTRDDVDRAVSSIRELSRKLSRWRRHFPMNASKSSLKRSAWVMGSPCGAPS